MCIARNEPSQHQPRRILPGGGGSHEPLPCPGWSPRATLRGMSVWVGLFVSSSHSTSWLCLFQTAKTLKISGTGHGVPAWLSPLGMVCACVWCWVLSPAWRLNPGEGPNSFLPSSCWGVELSSVPLVPKEQGFFGFSLFYPLLSKTHFHLLRGLPKKF